jgi:uncharacterized membrane protein (DUF485 family)
MYHVFTGFERILAPAPAFHNNDREFVMTHAEIHQLPEYSALIRARKKIVWPLSATVVLAYFALILTIAFDPAVLGTPVGSGVTSLGVVLGLGLIFFCMLVTGIYVYYANTVLEPLTRAIVEKAGVQKTGAQP